MVPASRAVARYRIAGILAHRATQPIRRVGRPLAEPPAALSCLRRLGGWRAARRTPGAQARAGDVLTPRAKSGVGNTGDLLECPGDPYYSTAEFTVTDRGTSAQIGTCPNGFSATSANVFSTFFCRSLAPYGAYNDPKSGVLNTTHPYWWTGTGLPPQHGRMSAGA